MANCIIFAEIKRTVAENIRPAGSRIRGRAIWMEEYDIRVHSIRVLVSRGMRKSMVGAMIRRREDQIRLEARRVWGIVLLGAIFSC